jgi:hypothetical protein
MGGQSKNAKKYLYMIKIKNVPRDKAITDASDGQRQ